MPRPVIGICAAVEQASFGVWVDEHAVLLPLSYTRAVQRAGGVAMMLPPDPATTESPGEVLDHLDALVLGGGADIDVNPERDRFETALARAALERDLPLLGVCRGMQILNVAAGGSLEQHLPDRLGHDRHRVTPGSWSEHEVRLEPGSLAAEAAGAEQLTIKSHHHQGVSELGEAWKASGWSDEDETVEAIEAPDRSFALGVLWHPEEEPEGRVIPALAEAAEKS
ncbi:MAG: gamma-glutamyl-gamma-aminobutyrate hydrolase family protein [Solirubrobacterales bacterium]